MAEKERLTKAERRAQARAERKRQEEEAKKKAQRQRLVNTTATIGVLVVIAVILIPTFQRFFGGEDEAAAATITQAEAAAAFDAAGCVRTTEDEPLPEPYTHYDPAEAPPADVLYTGVRPTNSGAHYGSVVGAVGGVPARQLDERGTTHNLEHGAVIVWFDPAVDGGTQGDIGAWQEAKIAAGFDVSSGGTVFASPYDGEFTAGKPIALRAWGQAWDCDTWDATVADAFVIDYWGTHGIAPERPLSPYPAGVLGYTDANVEDNTEAPTGDRHGESEDEASEGVSDDASDDATPSEDASAEPSDDASSSDG